MQFQAQGTAHLRQIGEEAGVTRMNARRAAVVYRAKPFSSSRGDNSSNHLSIHFKAGEVQTGWVGERRGISHRAETPSIRSSSTRGRTSVAIPFAWLQAFLPSILCPSKQVLFIKSSGDP